MAQAAREEIPPDMLDAVRVEQVRLLYADGGVGRVVSVAVAVMLCAILLWQRTLGVWPAAILIVALSLQAGVRIWACRAFRRTEITAQNWRLWAHRDVAVGVLGGVIWGAAMPWLFAPDRLDLQAVVITLIVGGASNYAGMNGAYRPSLYTAFLMYPPAIIWLLVQGDAMHIAWAVMLLIWLPDVIRRGARIQASLAEALVLRFQNAAMAEDLRAQTQRAEESTLAKSRFLAAASHDLRQPVHALSMFVGALRRHRLPKRSADLVQQIDQSVGALDGLFGSLLDISQLDAGVIETSMEAVRVWPLMERICRDLEDEALGKGVGLRVIPTRLAVRSDPVLLERILRNLIGNAVRYTATGHVLVGCRRQGGRVRLEVWDTGPGIAPNQLSLVFEEFYQVSNPGRDRDKGLGLGLPIVKRLSRILDHPLEVRSRPGQGSLFAISAPRASMASVAAMGAASDDRPATGRIIAIDDEQAIRGGVSALLGGWGFEVLTAANGAEAMAVLADAGPPDLILCDFRLGEDDDGIAVIQRIKARYGSQIPAILVTGDTALHSRSEAEAQGYLLMHKPLSHARLRAAVNNLLARRSRPRTPAE